MTDTPLTRLAAEPEEVRRRKGTLHTPGEILQQPWVWRDTAQRAKTLAQRSDALLKDAEFVVLTGAGSSLHAARMIEDAARARFGSATSTVSCTDLMLLPEAFIPGRRKGVLFSLSRSGESPEAVEAARVVAQRFPDVAHVAITCNAKGRLAQFVAAHPKGLCLVLHEKSYDKGLGTTSSVTGTALAGRLLLDPSAASRVQTLAKAGEDVLAGADLAERAARRDPQRVVVLGTGAMEAAAQEGAHKILELTDGQVATMGRSYLEFRHGPIAFLNPKTLLLCLVSPDPLTRRYEMDFIARTPQMWVLAADGFMTAGEGEQLSANIRDSFFVVNDASSLLPGEAAILGVVYAQMMALFISLRRGLKPDQPGDRGLVNPIVQGVTIYPRGGAP